MMEGGVQGGRHRGFGIFFMIFKSFEQFSYVIFVMNEFYFVTKCMDAPLFVGYLLS